MSIKITSCIKWKFYNPILMNDTLIIVSLIKFNVPFSGTQVVFILCFIEFFFFFWGGGGWYIRVPMALGWHSYWALVKGTCSKAHWGMHVISHRLHDLMHGSCALTILVVNGIMQCILNSAIYDLVCHTSKCVFTQFFNSLW